jgi:Sigma-70, region 4
MAPLNSLPTDQRLVLHLLLQEHRSYAEIAELLSTTRATVRARAFAAFDSAEPTSDIAFERRALIVDYLTGQLPQPVADEIAHHLSQSASEQAWVAAVRSELGQALIRAVPSNPADVSTIHDPDQQTSPQPVSSPGGTAQLTQPAEKVPIASARQHRPPATRALFAASTAATLLIIVGVIVIASTGTSRKPATSLTPTTSSAAVSNTPNTTATTATSSTGKTPVDVLARITLAPATSGSKITGIAEVLQQGSKKGLVIGAQDVPPNKKHPTNAYAVWLYNSPTDAHILGFVNPGVGKNGRLTTAGSLPSYASHYRTLIITLETQASPKTPGVVVLQGNLTGL